MLKKYIQCVQNENKNVSPRDTIFAIKQAGFDGAFIQWYDEPWNFSEQEQVDLCRELGLEIEFAHLGYQNMNDIWLDNETGEKLANRYIKNLDECKNNNINIVVIHLQSKHNAPEPNKIGLERFKKIIEHAEKLKIKVAFENTKLPGYLEYILDNIQSEYVGICLDVGHLHCHFKDKLNWNKFKNKIFAVHLHDNFGEKDEHLLPFDGNIDWNSLIKNLKEANYSGPITLESCYRNNYLNISLDDFYKSSYKKASEIYKIYKNVK